MRVTCDGAPTEDAANLTLPMASQKGSDVLEVSSEGGQARHACRVGRRQRHRRHGLPSRRGSTILAAWGGTPANSKKETT